MLEAIREAAPRQADGTLAASHYQVAAPQEQTDQNRRGAGRPQWLSDPGNQPYPLTQAPDVLPGRYLVRFFKIVDKEGKREWEEVGERAEVLLRLPGVAPAPAPAPAPVQLAPTRASKAETPQDLLAATLSVAEETTGIGATMGVQSFNEARATIKALELELREERARNGELQGRIHKLIEEKMGLADLVIDKLTKFAAMVALTPPPAQEASYISVVREVWTGLEKALAHVAPGLNAKLGAAVPAALPGASAPAPALPAAAPIPPRVKELVTQLATEKPGPSLWTVPAFCELAQLAGVADPGAPAAPAAGPAAAPGAAGPPSTEPAAPTPPAGPSAPPAPSASPPAAPPPAVTPPRPVEVVAEVVEAEILDAEPSRGRRTR